MSLDEKGRCCGRKPLVYKREGFLWCSRCSTRYPIKTNRPGITPIRSSVSGVEWSDSEGRRIVMTAEDEAEVYRLLAANPKAYLQYSRVQVALLVRAQRSAWDPAHCRGCSASRKNVWDPAYEWSDNAWHWRCNNCGTLTPFSTDRRERA